MEHGLHSSYIERLFIDKDNFVWLASNEMLECFDGYRFSPVNRADSTGRGRLFNQLNDLWQQDADHYWMATSAGLFVYSAREGRFTFVPLLGNMPNEDYSVLRLVPTESGKRLIVVTNRRGNYVMDVATRALDSGRSSLLDSLTDNTALINVLLDTKHRLWTMDERHCLRLADLRRGRPLPLRLTPEAGSAVRHSAVEAFLEDRASGRVYMGLSHGGILVYDPAVGVVRPVAGNNGDLYVRCLLLTGSGKLLIGTDNEGIWMLNRESEQLDRLELTGLEEVDSRRLKVHALCEDRDGNVLAGLFQRGLLVLPHSSANMDYLPLNMDGGGKNSSCVADFALSPEGLLWTATDGSGIFVTAPDGGTAPASDGLSSLLVQALAFDGEGRLWCASWNGGVQVRDGDKGWVTPAYLDTLRQSGVMDLCLDARSHCLYAAVNGGGLVRIDPNRHTQVRLHPMEIIWPGLLKTDTHRGLWVGDAVFSYRLDLDNGLLRQIESPDGGHIPMAHDFAQLGDSAMLMATANGLYACDVLSARLVRMPALEATRGINVLAAQTEDSLVWMTSDHGLLCLNVRSGRLLRFSSLGGYSVGEFHKSTALLSPDGRMAIGGDNGALRFSTAELLRSQGRPSPVHFTSFSVGGREVEYKSGGGSGQVLDRHILFATQARLPMGDNSFNVTFSVNDLGNPRLVKYAYTLEGYEDSWHETLDGQPRAYYASLPSGDYTLRVRACYENADMDSGFSEAVLRVHVPYPWYATTWAYLLYALLATAFAALVVRNLKVRQQARVHLRNSIHKEQIKEAQLKLFTSIAHELRSPLTMIVSPLGELIHNDPDAERQQSYQTMRRNANRLLRIVGQITDIRKMDKGQFTLHFSPVDFTAYLAETMASFTGVAAAKNIHFTREDDGLPHSVWIDPDHFEKVLVNLLSNAFKFTPPGGSVVARVGVVAHGKGTPCLRFSLFNSGSHLSQSDQAHLFERFYQSDAGSRMSGSGIGLNLTHELVRLHHGQVEAHNMEPDGVEFVVLLPLGNAHLTPQEMLPADTSAAHAPAPTPRPADSRLVESVADDETAQAEAVEQLVDSHGAAEDAEAAAVPARRRPCVLLVDDDVQLLDYMRQSLGGDYEIHTANSGNTAWQWLLGHRPEAVVTDVMMPDGDGYSLCRRIKGNPETDHIALIVLTSQGTQDNRLMAAELQVEHFLTKPFDIRLLQSSLRQVLSVRETLLGRLRRTEIGHDYDSVTLVSADDNLLRRVHDSIMKHLDDPEYGVEQLASEIGISRVHLNRRLRQLYNVSPGAYIRSIRLKQAAYLLANSRVGVSEVAWRVGFSSLSYFSANFRKHFGMSPKEFIAAYGNGEEDENLQKLL